MGRRENDELLWTIRRVFLDPLVEFDHITDEEKLYQCFGYPEREIYKRKILKRFRLEGYWWGAALEKVRASRSIKFGRDLYCFVREDDDVIDIEIRINTVNKTEWFTCTLTKKEYEALDSYLGPKQTCCIKHKEEEYDFKFGCGD